MEGKEIRTVKALKCGGGTYRQNVCASPTVETTVIAKREVGNDKVESIVMLDARSGRTAATDASCVMVSCSANASTVGPCLHRVGIRTVSGLDRSVTGVASSCCG